jgi:hypothetical protein
MELRRLRTLNWARCRKRRCDFKTTTERASSIQEVTKSFFNSIGQIRSFGDAGSMSGLPESGHGPVIYEYTL